MLYVLIPTMLAVKFVVGVLKGSLYVLKGVNVSILPAMTTTGSA